MARAWAGGAIGDAARKLDGDGERLLGRASRDGRRASIEGLRASREVRRPDAAEEVEARGRWDDDDADGITRVGVRVDVSDDDRGWIGLVARGVCGLDGGEIGRAHV